MSDQELAPEALLAVTTAGSRTFENQFVVQWTPSETTASLVVKVTAGGSLLDQQVVTSTVATLYERPAGAAGPGWTAYVAFAPDQPNALTFADAWSNYLGDPRAGCNGGTFVIATARPADPPPTSTGSSPRSAP
ncbi:hypothetical protein [Streptomyces sp. ME19-01-6]|uniref:hypothetical protein n=1 Tax=Streptomyces sp. ME19-01-6 TaxID=3028686 RepID=UPI0029A92034|nr:hypothetical protein [Streptomyces sp. ME19-01-6]MDX3233130.1 hypothetical protein [Streptomyces sp. ME19-01-6]